MSDTKLDKLKELLKSYERVLIAFSGGVDSTFLAKIASDTLHENAICAIASSAAMIEAERMDAQRFAKENNIELHTVYTNELELDSYRLNKPDRCYHCKKLLMGEMLKLAKQHNCNYVLDGFNVDDTKDYRPGLKAADELGIKHPLFEAGLNKKEIRNYSRKLGLDTWDKPSMACLASRFPYETEITEDRLKRIEQVEGELRKLGFVELRARFHDPVLRIELAENEIEKMLSLEIRRKVVKLGNRAGFKFVSLDLQGYKTGNLNRILDGE